MRPAELRDGMIMRPTELRDVVSLVIFKRWQDK
jgi:hypothetical protein